MHPPHRRLSTLLRKILFLLLASAAAAAVSAADLPTFYEVVVGGGPQNWSAVASSADGSKLAATANGGFIYVYETRSERKQRRPTNNL